MDVLLFMGERLVQVNRDEAASVTTADTGKRCNFAKAPPVGRPEISHFGGRVPSAGDTRARAAMTKRTILGALTMLGAVSAVMLAGTAGAAEVKVISTGSFKEALGELAPAFEKSSGHTVVAIWAGTDEIIRRLGAGETLDIVIAPATWIDDMSKRGLLVADSRADVARSGIGVALRAGAPRIDIGSGEALRKALLGAKSIVLSSGVSGVYLNGLFRTWGIADEVKSKIVTLPGSGPVADALVRGEAEIGFLQVSELLPVKGIAFLGPLPADIQEMTAITAALSRTAGAADAARALVKFLTSPAAAPAKKTTGLEPG
jgi:molybdate transport system substrate-binding protein